MNQVNKRNETGMGQGCGGAGKGSVFDGIRGQASARGVMGKGSTKMDEESGVAARKYMNAHGLVCFDMKMSGNAKFDREWLGLVLAEMAPIVGAVKIVPELAAFQDVYEKKNVATDRVEGVGQRVYFPRTSMPSWIEFLAGAGVHQPGESEAHLQGQVTVPFEGYFDEDTGGKLQGQWEYFHEQLGGTRPAVVDAVLGLDQVFRKGPFQGRAVMATRAFLLFLAAQAEEMGIVGIGMQTAVGLRRVRVGDRVLRGDVTGRARTLWGWGLVVGEEETVLLKAIREGKVNWSEFGKAIGSDMKMKLATYAEASAYVTRAGLGKTRYEHEASDEQEARKQVVIFHVEGTFDVQEAKLQAEEAIGVELAQEGVTQDPATGTALAREKKAVDNVWVGSQNRSGRPFAIVTCQSEDYAKMLEAAHALGCGAMRRSVGRGARFVLGEPRHQREAVAKAKSGGEGVWGAPRAARQEGYAKGEGYVYKTHGGMAAPRPQRGGGPAVEMTMAEKQALVEVAVKTAVEKAMAARDAAERRVTQAAKVAARIADEERDERLRVMIEKALSEQRDSFGRMLDQRMKGVWGLVADVNSMMKGALGYHEGMMPDQAELIDQWRQEAGRKEASEEGVGGAGGAQGEEEEFEEVAAGWGQPVAGSGEQGDGLTEALLVGLAAEAGNGSAEAMEMFFEAEEQFVTPGAKGGTRFGTEAKRLKRRFLTSPQEMAAMVKVALRGHTREQLELMEAEDELEEADLN